MKNEIMQKIGAVINALNNVSVMGEQNLATMLSMTHRAAAIF